jgi:hypothetical protein
MCLSKIVVQGECFIHCFLGVRQSLQRRYRTLPGKYRIALGQTGIGGSVTRIFLDRFLEEGDRSSP